LEALLMALAPLLDAAPAIPIHAFAAMAAFGLGVVQLAAPKGTLPHRTLGWIWVGLMLSVAVSSFWIHQIRLVGPWSPIHLLSIFVLITVPLAVWRAHQHRVADHRRIRDLGLLRRPGDRGPVHAAAGTDHARGGVRPLGPPLARGLSRRISALEHWRCRTRFPARFRDRGTASVQPPKSLEKRREKPRRDPVKGWFRRPRCAI
jgi:uncharacterized membrane protein